MSKYATVKSKLNIFIISFLVCLFLITWLLIISYADVGNLTEVHIFFVYFQIAVFVAPVVSVFLSVFGFANKYEDLPSMYHLGYNISYFRATFHGSFSSLYSYNRSDLPCHQFYCHYKKPEKFLREMGFPDFDPIANFCWIIIFGSVMYMLTVIAVWYRLNKR